MSRGIWVSDHEFVQFAEPADNLADQLGQQIATRASAGEFSWGLLPNPDPILRQMGASIRTYRQLSTDALVKGARRRRKAAVISMERGFDRGDAQARVTKNLQAVFDDLPIVQIIRGLIEGAFYGYHVAEVIWGRVGGLIVPTDVKIKPPEWFGFDGQTDELRFRAMGSATGTAVPDRKFIVVGNERTYHNPYGEPDLASCFWPVAFRRGGLKFWVTFTEKYGMPWAVGKLRRGASLAETNDLVVKLDAMVRDAVAVIPDDSSVEFLTVQTTANADIYEKLLMYCSREISIALLGNNQSVEMSANRASAQAAQHVETDLRDADADMVAAGLNQLAQWICDVNWPSAQCPTYEFWEQEEVDQTLAERDKTLSDAGVVFSKDYYTRTYNLLPGDIVSVGKAVSGTDAPAPADAGTTDFSEPGTVPPDQAAIDAAVDQLPADQIQAAMVIMLQPALDAIALAEAPDAVLAALADAYPKMDSSALEALMTQAFFVADVVGRKSETTQ